MQLENGYNLSQKVRKTLKKQHRKKMRQIAKRIDNPNPKYNRYDGWVI